jgi:hypothetical protein
MASPFHGIYVIDTGGLYNMTYQEFKQQVKSEVQTQLGQSVTITIQDIIKNNNTHLDGLTILSEQCNLSPTIYLNYYYTQYEKGKSVSEICQDILQTYEANCPSANIDVSFFTDYSKVKSRIVFKLINYEKNLSLLQDVPHYRILDLAIVFHCLINADSNGTATILIHNHHLSLWDITRDDLYALAVSNTPRLLNYDLRNMTDVLKELFQQSDSIQTDSAELLCPMYVLSNQLKLNGSACILYQGLLKGFADQLGCDLYILPSSIHEVLILPSTDQLPHPELSDMVREVNMTQLSREEILSDHVYYFSRETSQLTM